MSQHFPVFLKLKGRSVLVVGAGKVAHEKLCRLIETGAQILIIARHIGLEVAQLAAAHQDSIRLLERDIEPRDVLGHALVINATNDPATNALIASAARAAGIWSNAVDDPEPSDFYTAGVLRRGPITIAIASEGRFPGLVRALRTCLDELLPESHVSLIEDIAYLRKALKNHLPNQTERFNVLRRLGEELRRNYFARI